MTLALTESQRPYLPFPRNQTIVGLKVQDFTTTKTLGIFTTSGFPNNQEMAKRNVRM